MNKSESNVVRLLKKMIKQMIAVIKEEIALTEKIGNIDCCIYGE
jgi:hypothetical protein